MYKDDEKGNNLVESLMILKKLNILFVEDEKEIAEEMIETLNLIFNKVYYAKNGIEALDIYKTTIPDLILTDIQMDEMDGLKFATTVREKDSLIPIVFLTSFSHQQYLFDAINISSDGYIIKPVNFNKIIDIFSNIIKRKNNILRKINISKDIEYNLNTKELLKKDEQIVLGNKEQALLKLFISNHILTKEDINYYLYPLDSITDSAIKNLVTRLKNKLGKNSITYIKGSGWKLNIRY